MPDWPCGLLVSDPLTLAFGVIGNDTPLPPAKAAVAPITMVPAVARSNVFFIVVLQLIRALSIPGPDAECIRVSGELACSRFFQFRFGTSVRKPYRLFRATGCRRLCQNGPEGSHREQREYDGPGEEISQLVQFRLVPQVNLVVIHDFPHFIPVPAF